MDMYRVWQGESQIKNVLKTYKKLNYSITSATLMLWYDFQFSGIIVAGLGKHIL